MRTVYLIRHGRPDFPDEEKWCLGSTDLGLGTLGRLQACLLGEVLKSVPISQVFCSPLSRSVETARFLSENPVIVPGLEEAGSGVWDGLSFAEIRRRWPELYEKRAEDLNLLPPGAEVPKEAAERFEKAMRQILENSQGDVAVVAHKTVNQMMICKNFGVPLEERHGYQLEYTSVSRLEYHKGVFRTQEIGKVFLPALTEDLCRRLLHAASVPAAVQQHCKAVAEEAKRIREALKEAGHFLDEQRILCSAWLHDIARVEKNHPEKGAMWMKKLGYGNLASVIAQHHDLENPLLIDEAAVVHLADKCIQGTKRVALEERFAASSEKCQTEEAKKAHQNRYETVILLKNKVHEICKEKIVE